MTPRSKRFVPADVQFNGSMRDNCNTDWINDICIPSRDVCVARAVLPNGRYTDIPVRLINTSIVGL